MLALLVGLWLSGAAAAVDGAGAWSGLVGTLIKHKELGPLNLQVGDADGLLANVTVGDWNSSEVVTPLWSASKLASGALFFALDAEGILPLDAKVSDYLDYWTTNSSDPRSLVTVKHLLDFTSGFGGGDCTWAQDPIWERCTQDHYDNEFRPELFGKADYNEGHLHIAQTIAMKVTNAGNYSHLWYHFVGRHTGLPEGEYWGYPSTEHPMGGSGLVMSSEEYAMFLSSFFRSLYSSDQPTAPLKMGERVGYGRDFFGPGGLLPTHNAASQSYLYTSWRGLDTGFVHSVGCAGWLPGLQPAAEDHAGWWVMLARRGSVLGCIGALQSEAFASVLVPEIAVAVRAHRAIAAPVPFVTMHGDVVCKRSAVMQELCECPSHDKDCGTTGLCESGLLTESACTPPYLTFRQEGAELCGKCEQKHDGHGRCIQITAEKARKLGARRCYDRGS